MKSLTISYPDMLLKELNVSESEFAHEMKFLLAAKLYELGKISSGKAAKMCALDRVSFLEKLGQYQIPAINIQGDEIEKEVQAVKRIT